MRKGALGLLSCLLAMTAGAQWDVPAKVQLNGSAPNDRQVTGLSAPDAPEAGVAVASARTLSTNYALAQGQDVLTASLTPPIAAYFPGLLITLVPTQANHGAVSLSVDGLSALAVHKFVSLPLDSADLRPGIPVTVVFDGSAFQITSQLEPGCPAGTIAFTRDACIEAATRDSLTFYNANLACVAANGRLCTMNEWTRACLQVPGFTNSVAAFEWADDAANFSGNAKVMGYDGVSPLPNCRSGGHTDPFGLRPYRCCFDR